MRVGSLCSGFGGLDLGLERAGWSIAWHVELDAACSAVLERHWPGVPNHGDLKAVSWEAVEPVDLVCGGYPCQPFSHAGRRRGEDDPRHLWPFVCAAIRVLRPRLALLENVSGHRSLGFGRVLGDLAEIGYDACWASVRASDVGAPHGRERVFILASPADPGRLEQERRRGPGEVAGQAGQGEGGEEERERVRDAARGGGEAAPDTHDERCEGAVALALRHGGRDGDAPVADPEGDPWRLIDGDGLCARWGEYEPAIRRWEAVFGEPAPDPLDGRGRLNVDLTRWMMGFPPGWHGDTPRTHALKGYGNAVQVQVGELVGRWAAPSSETLGGTPR